MPVGGVFVSYRRDDTAGSTGRLCDQLEREGIDVFRDIDDIPPGRDFREVIQEALGKAEVVLVVIGIHWLTVSDNKGIRRLDSASDTHRVEVAAALRSDARVIPVLVEGSTFPSVEDLPDDLNDLAYKNAWELSDRRFTEDGSRLAAQIRRAQEEVEASRAALRRDVLMRTEAERRDAEEASRRRADVRAREEEVAERERLESEARLRRETATADYYVKQTKRGPPSPLEWIGWGIAFVFSVFFLGLFDVYFVRFLFVTTTREDAIRKWSDAVLFFLVCGLFTALAIGLGLRLVNVGKRRRTKD